MKKSLSKHINKNISGKCHNILLKNFRWILYQSPLCGLFAWASTYDTRSYLSQERKLLLTHRFVRLTIAERTNTRGTDLDGFPPLFLLRISGELFQAKKLRSHIVGELWTKIKLDFYRFLSVWRYRCKFFLMLVLPPPISRLCSNCKDFSYGWAIDQLAWSPFCAK